MIELTPSQRRRAIRFSLGIVIAVVCLFTMTLEGQRQGCERGKLDRKTNAAAFTAQKEYLSKVLAAASVKQDVKTAADAAQEQFAKTSAELHARSKVDCRPLLRWF